MEHELPILGTLDLHTFRPSETGDLVPEYLEACRQKGILSVRVVHGKGTGALREGVHRVLERLSFVESFRLCGAGEGGWGATRVLLKPLETESPSPGKRESPLFGSEVTRRIWTNTDALLLVYVGSAAEFALVEENHWLFFTGKLPASPWDRFVSTLVYNRKIFMTPEDKVGALARSIRQIHDQVEKDRSRVEKAPKRIGERAFRAVGSMLIDYAVRAEAYLARRPLDETETETYYQDQKRFFEMMGLRCFEKNHATYLRAREKDMENELKPNRHTLALFAAYRRDLGAIRYWVLLQFMARFCPPRVVRSLGLKKNPLFGPVYWAYPRFHRAGLSPLAQRLLLPRKVREALTQ